MTARVVIHTPPLSVLDGDSFTIGIFKSQSPGA